jgi:hypothetical protein
MNRNYIKAEKTDNSLILTLNNLNGAEECGVRAMDDYRECEPDWQSDAVMHEFFEDFIANTEYEWINPEEIGALTDAPILGVRDENENVIEAYGWMNYAVQSLMDALYNGKAVLQKG